MKIACVEAIPVRLPRDREQAVGTAGSPTPLRRGTARYRWSTTVRALYPVDFETALIKITMDSGLVGWGEAQAPLAPEVACAIVDLLLAPQLQDLEFTGAAADIEEIWQRLYETMRVRGQTGGFMLDAISGVDLALWDLAGKILHQPVCRLLSGNRAKKSVEAYLSGLPGDAVARALGHQAEGFRTFKLFLDAGPADLFSALDALQAACAPGSRFAVDALWRLTPEDAPTFGAELDCRGALWLEAPLPLESPEEHAALARSIRTPLALGESYRTHYELAPFFRQRAMGFVQPDLGRTGITEGRRIAAAAADEGIEVVPHVSIAMGPQIAAAIHFAAATENCSLLEFNPAVFRMANRFLAYPLEMRGACYQVPDRPGLGADIA